MEQMYKKEGTLINLLQDTDIELGTDYIKFPNGLGIVFMRKDFSGSFSSQGGEYRLTLGNPFTFPFPFVEVPIMSIDTASTEDYAFCNVIGVYRSLNMINMIALVRPTPISDTTVSLQVIAIGRWK